MDERLKLWVLAPTMRAVLSRSTFGHILRGLATFAALMIHAAPSFAVGSWRVAAFAPSRCLVLVGNAAVVSHAGLVLVIWHTVLAATAAATTAAARVVIGRAVIGRCRVVGRRRIVRRRGVAVRRVVRGRRVVP